MYVLSVTDIHCSSALEQLLCIIREDIQLHFAYRILPQNELTECDMAYLTAETLCLQNPVVSLGSLFCWHTVTYQCMLCNA